MIDLGERWDDLSQDEKDLVLGWLTSFFKPGNKPYEVSSVAITKAFGRLTGLYISNEALKRAFEEAGFTSVDRSILSWQFYASATKEADKLIREYAL